MIRRWRCKSRTRPGVRYELVSTSDRVLSCSCVAGDYGRECWHRRLLAAWMWAFTEEGRQDGKQHHHKDRRRAGRIAA